MHVCKHISESVPKTFIAKVLPILDNSFPSLISDSQQARLRKIAQEDSDGSSFENQVIPGYEGCLPGPSLMVSFRGLVTRPINISVQDIKRSSVIIKWDLWNQSKLSKCVLSSSSRSFLIKTLMKEIKPVVTEKNEYEIRDITMLMTLFVISDHRDFDGRIFSSIAPIIK